MIELTERSPARLAPVARQAARLRELGFRLALDDVGAGNAGLEMLRTIPVDFVKVDRSVVVAALDEPAARAVLAAILAFAHERDAFVIAEGIETEQMLEFLRDPGIERTIDGIPGAQGYLLGRPSPTVGVAGRALARPVPPRIRWPPWPLAHAGRSLRGGRAVASLTASPASADVSGPDIVSFMNAQRAANGIPAGITEDPARSDGCRKHNLYGAQNGGSPTSRMPASPATRSSGEEAGRDVGALPGRPLDGDQQPVRGGADPPAPAVRAAHQRDGRRRERRLRLRDHAGQPGPPGAAGRRHLHVPGQRRDRLDARPRPRSRTRSHRASASAFRAGARTGPYLYVMYDGPGHGGRVERRARPRR